MLAGFIHSFIPDDVAPFLDHDQWIDDEGTLQHDGKPSKVRHKGVSSSSAAAGRPGMSLQHSCPGFGRQRSGSNTSVEDPGLARSQSNPDTKVDAGIQHSGSVSAMPNNLFQQAYQPSLIIFNVA